MMSAGQSKRAFTLMLGMNTLLRNTNFSQMKRLSHSHVPLCRSAGIWSRRRCGREYPSRLPSHAAHWASKYDWHDGESEKP